MSKLNTEQIFSTLEKLAADGDLNAAEQEFKQLLLDQEAIKARAYNNLGVIACQRKEAEQAMDYYQKAVDLAPDNLTYRKNLADLCYFGLGNAEAALQHYRLILDKKADDFDANLAIGRICADIGRHFLNEAADFFDLAEKIEPGNEFVVTERSRLNQESLEPESKTATVEQVLVNEVNPGKAYTDLATRFSTLEASETEEKILTFIKNHPNFALAYNDLGVISYQLQKMEAAAASYRKAVELEPENTTFRKNLADFIFMVEKNPQEAMIHYHEVLKRKPQDLEVLMMIGNLCLALNDPDKARDFFNLVLEHEPWHQDAISSLEMLDEHGLDPQP